MFQSADKQAIQLARVWQYLFHLFNLRPAVLKGAGAVEDQVVGSAVAVGAEVAHALELVACDAVGKLRIEN